MAEDCCDESGFFRNNIDFSAFAHLFCVKLLYFGSLKVAKSEFGIEGLTFRVCQGNIPFLERSSRSRTLYMFRSRRCF